MPLSEETGEGQRIVLYLFSVYIAVNGLFLDNRIPIHQIHSYWRYEYEHSSKSI